MYGMVKRDAPRHSSWGRARERLTAARRFFASSRVSRARPGGRDVRRWNRGENVTVTYCRSCRRGMSVIGIAFFSRPVAEVAQAA